MFPSTSGSPPHIAHGQARRKRSSGRYDSTPSLQTIASSFPINCTSFSSSGIESLTVFTLKGVALPHRCPLAEDSGADTDERRAFLDRDAEISGHPHRQVRQGKTEF